VVVATACADQARDSPVKSSTEDGEEPEPVAVDVDGDGYDAPADCDDGEAEVHPGAAEVCDGVDNDCDGRVDVDPVDGRQVWLDEDHDGVGRSDGSQVVCPDDVPAGWVDSTGDCDDTDGTTYPGAPERCDGVDGDCDGDVDEDAVDMRDWYLDEDGDGRGAGEVVQACEAPDGHVALDGDCDDTDPGRRPGLPEECDPAQGKDDDCDGLVDCEDSECGGDLRCEESDCQDGLDSDLDGLLDCFDDDCWGIDACQATSLEFLSGTAYHERYFGRGSSSSWRAHSISGIAARTQSGTTTSVCSFTIASATAWASPLTPVLVFSNRTGTVAPGCGFNPFQTLPPVLGHNLLGRGIPLGWGIWRRTTAPWDSPGTFTYSSVIAQPVYSARTLESSGSFAATSFRRDWRTYSLGGSVVSFPPTSFMTSMHPWW